MQINLIYIRKQEYGMTQKEFANMVGMAVDTYSKKERGDYPFTSDEMFDISEKLNIPIGKIFSKRKHQIGNKQKQEV